MGLLLLCLYPWGLQQGLDLFGSPRLPRGRGERGDKARVSFTIEFLGLCIPQQKSTEDSAGVTSDAGSIPESRRSPGEGHGNPLQVQSLSPGDALEEGMATRCSVLARRNP